MITRKERRIDLLHATPGSKTEMALGLTLDIATDGIVHLAYRDDTADGLRYAQAAPSSDGGYEIVIDVIDPDLFPIFEEEAAELLPQLGGALRQWASRPDNLSARSEVLRALHTLKGSGAMFGFVAVRAKQRQARRKKPCLRCRGMIVEYGDIPEQ